MAITAATLFALAVFFLTLFIKRAALRLLAGGRANPPHPAGRQGHNREEARDG